jgi:hypothetical protein
VYVVLTLYVDHICMPGEKKLILPPMMSLKVVLVLIRPLDCIN